MLGITQNGPTQMISGNIYEGLLRYDEKITPLPSLATSWTVNKEGTLYTFKLKPGVTWHDGKPFTSADVVFSADVFLRKTHARLRANLASVESIRAVDPLTRPTKGGGVRRAISAARGPAPCGGARRGAMR